VAGEHTRRRRENAWLAEIAALTRDQRQTSQVSFCQAAALVWCAQAVFSL
jgi:hypothetical protein